MPDQYPNQQSRQQAGQDMADIAALEKFDPFQRYWMRRLHQRHDELQASFETGEMSLEMREIKRCQMLLLREFITMPAKDRIAAAKEAEAPLQEAQRRPVQVG